MKYPFLYKNLNILSVLTIAIIVVIFYVSCYHFTYNFFYQDDFHLLRYVTIVQDQTVSFSKKLTTLWDLHNEHRIIFPRLYVLLDYYLQGHLDWQILNTVAALYYLGIFYFFTLIVKKVNLPVWYALPIGLFIFQPSSFENFYWTISILQQVGNLFWAMFLFYSLVYFSPKRFWLSIALATILTFTHGNGLFAFGVGAILLFFQKRYTHLSIWIGYMLLIAILYFTNYRTAQNSNIAESLSNPIRLIGCFGGFWGNFVRSLFKSNLKTIIGILAGLTIFGVLAFQNIKLVFRFFQNFKTSKETVRNKKEKEFLFAIFLFFSITAGLVALSRSWSSIEAGFQNRYLHNSVIAFVLLYVSILLSTSLKIRQFTASTFLVLGLCYYGFSWYTNYEILTFQRKTQESDSINYELNQISIVNDRSFNLNIAEKLQQSFKQGVSIIPKTPLMDAVKNLSKIKQISPIEYRIEIQKDSSYSFNISNSDYRDIYYFTNLNLPYRGDVYLVFKSPQNTFISPTSHRRNKKIQFLKTGVFFIEGFFGSVMTDAMPKGIYDIGILQKNNSQFIYLPTKYQITN